MTQSVRCVSLFLKYRFSLFLKDLFFQFFLKIEFQSTTSFQQQVFVYSRPIAGIRAKMDHETTVLQTSKLSYCGIVTYVRTAVIET